MPSPWKRPESVLVVVHSVDSAVLLIERTQPAGYWQSVTGSLEWDELDPLAAAVRELEEETGITGVAVRATGCTNRFPILPPWRHRYPPGVEENLEHVFVVTLPAPVPVHLRPDEHVASLWLPRAEAAERVFSYTNRDAILMLVPPPRA
ncbi:dihydroneopterin triphosphate pyrophosphatase [Plasticicumulans lactativorans]|uniref:Dihydroneopterin triphosphate pyrophosphatase n=1 Tax=Plasticicumulans lactativorans TaxID=1133106 RepID=A0A4R2L7U4_9GAMM|nr:dihydroneopterin triphosphate diphosphatase [Plasticicumulans lactativorans]TCO82028.1 dihydroneopterin triphosphate pyrophosphatase [Plasticicumulans lactativorans]